jgi:4-amino-4-deoxychorismate lyase
MRFRLISDLDPGLAPHVSERALHYGDGLFETMLLLEGEIRYWSAHYQRLSRDAERLGIACPEEEWFSPHLARYRKLGGDWVIKLILTRGDGGRGLELPENTASNLYLLHYGHKKSNKKQSVKAITSSVLLPVNRALAGIKHLNRLNYVLATRELKRHQQHNEAVLLNENGHVIEGIVNNLFFVKNQQLHTPDLALSGVQGVMRQQIINSLQQQGKTVKIADFGLADLLDADECFMCNAVQGIRAVVSVDQQDFPLGPVTRSLQQAFHGN